MNAEQIKDAFKKDTTMIVAVNDDDAGANIQEHHIHGYLVRKYGRGGEIEQDYPISDFEAAVAKFLSLIKRKRGLTFTLYPRPKLTGQDKQ